MKVYVVLRVDNPICDCCGIEYDTQVFTDRADAEKLERIWSKRAFAGDIIEIIEREVDAYYS